VITSNITVRNRCRPIHTNDFAGISTCLMTLVKKMEPGYQAPLSARTISTSFAPVSATQPPYPMSHPHSFTTVSPDQIGPVVFAFILHRQTAGADTAINKAFQLLGGIAIRTVREIAQPVFCRVFSAWTTSTLAPRAIFHCPTYQVFVIQQTIDEFTERLDFHPNRVMPKADATAPMITMGSALIRLLQLPRRPV